MVIPANLLVIASVIGVMLADTSFLSGNAIYYARFVPIGVLAFKVMANYVMKKPALRVDFSLAKYWMPFMLLATASTVYSLEPMETFQRSVSAWFVIIGFGLGFPFFLNGSDRIRKLVVLVSVVMSGAVLYSFHAAQEAAYGAAGSEDRLHGVFRNPNTLGMIAMQTTFVLFYLWQREKSGRKRYALLCGVIIAGITVLLSGSRASTLGLLAGFLVFSWANRKLSRRTAPGLVVALLLLGSVFLMFGYFFPDYSAGLFRTDTSSRTILWERCWKLSEDARFIGAGFGGTDELFVKDAEYLRREGIFLAGPHSSPLKLLVDLGFAGVALALYAFYKCVVRAVEFLPHFEDPELGVASLCIVAASLVNSMFEDWLFGFGNSSTIPFWFFLALLCYQADRSKAIAKQPVPEQRQASAIASPYAPGRFPERNWRR